MKTLKITSIVTGIVLAAGMGVTNAAPIQLSGAQMDDVTGGGYCFRCDGSVANASSEAVAWGHFNGSATHTFTFTASGASGAISTSATCTDSGC